jgi:2-polyprenyl-3-methyl-5-hydroxy-6-metoxy-1,4-benzoquinol methylase
MAAGCPVCSGVTSVPFLKKNGYTIARCAHCGTRHVDPLPSPEALLANYQDETYFEGCAEQGYRSYADMKKALLPHFRRRLGTLERQLGAPGRVLDFGCAAGYFLQVAQAAGWQIAGVEVSRAMAEQASQSLGAPVASSLDELAPGQFDAVTLWEVIEHVPAPVEVLRALRGRLRPGGVLMLSTPNTGHWRAVREPEGWDSYRPPSHLIYFDAETLRAALERAGFAEIEVSRVAPLPPLPGWLDRFTAPLQAGLSVGQARRWRLALYTWRAVRLAAWGWQKLANRRDDIFATLETVAFCRG